jgi:hypothetical protein
VWKEKKREFLSLQMIQMQVNQIKYKLAQILFENKVEDYDQKACKEERKKFPINQE